MTATLMQDEAQRHAEVVANYIKRTAGGEQVVQLARQRQLDFTTWAHQSYYIATDSGFATPIRLRPHQQIIMRLYFDKSVAVALGVPDGFQTIVFSTVKKSGKTAIAGAVARWIAETWGSHAEVYCMANDEEQARGRIYAAALASIELDPRYDPSAKGIPGLWRIIERHSMYLPTHGILKAVSVDYKGEAGSNPVATLWSELWGYSSESQIRMWEELTPVPTRPRSIRYVETYAGFDGESSILNKLEDRIKSKDNGSRRLTQDELRVLVPDIEWPWPDQQLPFFVHPQTRTIAYWDEGVEARRMPWQTPEYYAGQSDLRVNQFRRLHLNERVSSVDDFIRREWLDRLDVELPALDENTPVVIGADASVTGDCTGISAVSRDPKDPANVLHRRSQMWKPADGRPLDYSVTIEPALRKWCTGHIHPLDQDCRTHAKADVLGPCEPSMAMNVVEIAYDPYQLHDLMTRLRNEAVAYCRPFSQQTERMIADKAFYDLIRDQRFHYNRASNEYLREHILNCGAKYPPDDNTRLRLVKKAADSNIDLAVATSMACKEALRLNL